MTQSTKIKLANILFALLSFQFIGVAFFAIIFGCFFLVLNAATAQYMTFTVHSTPVQVSHATVIFSIGLICFLPSIALALLFGGLVLPVSRRVCFSMGILAHLIVFPPFSLYWTFLHATPAFVLFLFTVVYSLFWWYLVAYKFAPALTTGPPPLPNNALQRTEAGGGVDSDSPP